MKLYFRNQKIEFIVAPAPTILDLKAVAEYAAQGAFSPSALNHARLALRRAKSLPETTVGSGQSLRLEISEAFEILLVRQLTDTRVASLERAATIVSKFRASHVGFFGRQMRIYFDHAFGKGHGYQFETLPFESILKIYGRRFGRKSHLDFSLNYYNSWSLLLFARNPKSPTPDLDLMVASPILIGNAEGGSLGEVREIYPLYYPGSLTRETHKLAGRFNGAAVALDLSIMFGAVSRLYAIAQGGGATDDAQAS